MEETKQKLKQTKQMNLWFVFCFCFFFVVYVHVTYMPAVAVVPAHKPQNCRNYYARVRTLGKLHMHPPYKYECMQQSIRSSCQMHCTDDVHWPGLVAALDNIRPIRFVICGATDRIGSWAHLAVMSTLSSLGFRIKSNDC